MSKYKDIAGKRYSKLVAIERIGANIHRKSIWRCICDCGNETNVSLGELLTGNTQSCGCLRFKHGITKDSKGYRMLHIWNGMIGRTSSLNNKDFIKYGVRGIRVCDEWKGDFKKFYDWSMSNGYEENLTIDRINNDGNYEPNNCRWATVKTQSNNRRNNVFLNFNNENHTIAQWGEIVGINSETIRARVNRGWDVNKALTTPLKIKELNGGNINVKAIY